jgi:DNA-binding NarL/FixJ family response regulator
MRESAKSPSAANLSPITVVLARFDELRARGLSQLIASDESLAIVAEGIEPSRIPVALRAHRPDVAVLDIAGLGRPSEVRELSTGHPATRLVLMAERLSSVECAQMLSFGASACLDRDTQARDVLNAIHLASRGLQLTPGPAGGGEGAIAGGQLLTLREAEVLSLLQQGSTNPQIALALSVSVETIRTHARNIFRKLGVSSRRELMAAPVAAQPPQSLPAAGVSRRRLAARPVRSRRGHGSRHL